MTAAVLFLGEIMPKMLAKRHPVHVAFAFIPVVRALYFVLWPVSVGVTRATSRLLARLGMGKASPSVTGEEIEYLIEMGTRGGRARRGEGGAPQQRAGVRRPGGPGDHGAAHPHGRPSTATCRRRSWSG